MALVKIYANLVINGRKTIADVPKKLQLAVEEYIKELEKE